MIEGPVRKAETAGVMPTLFQPEFLYHSGRLHTGASLLVDEDGSISGIGTNAGEQREAKVVRLPGKALLPGFVNVHSHAFQRLIRGRTESTSTGGRNFWSWRGAMYHAAATLSPDQMYHVARAAFLEMALAGTTAVGEFHYVQRAPDGSAYQDPNTMAHQVIAAAQSVGIRICLLRCAYQRAGFGLPPDPGQTRFLETTTETIDALDALHTRYSSPAAWVGAAPHSVRALAIDAIDSIAGWAREHGSPLHMHVSEQTAEVDACRAEYGTTPIRLLARHHIPGERFTAVHATHIDEEEMALLAAARSTVCACPTTERNLGDGILSARQLIERGVRVAFGSDSQAQIEPLEDAREMEYHLRLHEQRRSVLDAIDGEELSARLLHCATANGARSLACNAGELAPGRLADFFTVDLNDISIAGSAGDHLLSAIVFGMRAAAVVDVCVGGQFIVRDRHHPEQAEILKQYQEVARSVWREPQPASKP